MADAYAADLILPPFMVHPRLESMGDLSLEGLADLAGKFSASVTATSIRAMRLSRQPLILVAHNLYGRKWQWPTVNIGGLRVRDDLDPRATAFTSLLGGETVGPAKKQPADYWFDRRHVAQFDVRVQSLRTVDGEVLTLLRVLDPRMVEIYG
jgi:hypothetical protein